MKSNLALGSLATLIVAASVVLWAPWQADSPGPQLIGQAESSDQDTLPESRATQDERGVVRLEVDRDLQLPVHVISDLGFDAPGVRIGFDFAAPRATGPPQRQARTNEDGQAVFQFDTSDFAGREIAMCTVALLIPSDPPQVQEVRADRLGLTPIRFTRPATGPLTVIVTRSDGIPLPDDTLVYLQLAGPRFRPQLSRCVSSAKTVNGEAYFPNVGLDSKVTIGVKNEFEESGYTTRDIRGPSKRNEGIIAELILPGPPPVVELIATGEGGVAAAHEKLIGEVNYRGENLRDSDFEFHAQLDKEGVAKIDLPPNLARATSALLATRVVSKATADSADLRLGLRLLYHKTLSGQFQKWLVHHGNDLMVSGRIIDQHGAPYVGGPLRFTVSEQDPKARYTNSLYWDFHADAKGSFQIYAPNLPSLKYKLESMASEGRQRLNFMPGAKDEEFSISLPPAFLGRVLVDDPSFLPELTFDRFAHLDRGDRRYGPPRILQSDGTFEYRAKKKGRPLPNLYLKGTGELISTDVYEQGMPKREGNRWRFPDWDLRGKLFKHNLTVKNEDGGSVGKVAYRFDGIEGGRLVQGNGRLGFVSTDAQVPIIINATGYREQKVMSKGTASVALTKGIPLQVNFNPPLPIANGVQWRVLLVELLDESRPEIFSWQNVRGKVAHLSLPRSGDWTLHLRACWPDEGPRGPWRGLGLPGQINGNGYSFKAFNKDLEIDLNTPTVEYDRAIDDLRELRRSSHDPGSRWR